MFKICKYMFFGLRYENTTTTTTDFKGGSFCKFLDHYTSSSTFLKKWTLPIPRKRNGIALCIGPKNNPKAEQRP